MTFLFELANKPGTFFVETETVRLDEVTRMCYAGREVKGSQELLAELVSLGFAGFVYDDECYLDYLAFKGIHGLDALRVFFNHILESQHSN